MGLSPWLKPLLKTDFRIKLCEQFPKRNLQRHGDLLKNIDRGVVLAPLQAAEIRAINIGIEGQSLLRHAPLNANSPDIPTNKSAPIHKAQGSIL